MEKVKAQKRNGELDFFKLLFCIVVISFHSGYFIQSENGYFKGGSIAVDFFFVVSGVMMARNAAKKAYEENLGIDTFEFMKKKILCPIFMLHGSSHLWLSTGILFLGNR